ncbi:SDR family oxidoreductase [Janibacter alittae]|uniref:NmrA family NAD(P)-binding protein n=1 Tax=Janibacter alittae TaxID=3115209 RepID=A0ABZ2MGI9_9MICO
MRAPSAEIAVISGRGKTGTAVVSALADLGVGARALGRAERADPGTDLRGCRAVYLMAPNMAPDEPDLVREVLAAARSAGVTRVVYHSVAAPYAPLMPHHVNKAVAEDLVRRSGTDWTILQPCAYVQNVIPGLQGEDPGIDVAYDLDAPFGLVDVADVAQAAATVLTRAEHIGATYELGGPDLVGMRDVAAIAQEVLSRPVRARRIGAWAWAAGAGAGLDPREQEWLLAMFAYYDRYGLPARPRTLSGLLGRPPRDVREVLARELDPGPGHHRE